VRAVGVISASARRAGRSRRPRREPGNWRFSPTTLLLLTTAAIGGCSDFDGPDSKYGISASPRVVAGREVAKGGGDYKVGRPYKVAGRWYVPREAPSYDRTGIASWYGSAFHGRRTANGEVFDMGALTAGHPTLPLPSYAYVTNLQNGRTIMVRVNDRGPYVNDRIIDLSWRSAKELGYAGHGLARVRVRYAGPAPLNGSDATERQYLAAQSWHGPGNQNQAVAQNERTEPPLDAMAALESNPKWSVVGYRQRLYSQDTKGETRVALGGPQSSIIDVGPFATLAEAERMRHVLKDAALAVVDNTGTDEFPAYRVRAIPLNGPSDEGSSELIQRLGAALGEPALR
jgi:rare lipoprotein A